MVRTDNATSKDVVEALLIAIQEGGIVKKLELSLIQQLQLKS